jgi:putative CocE/NonD family hydrolase
MSVSLSWFDQWLKGRSTDLAKEQPVRIFIMGENKWRYESEWPLNRTQYTKYYLRSSGPANGLYGKGTLSTTPPGKEPSDVYTYNPEDPVPTLGGNVSMNPTNRGAVDQRSIEVRYDVLVYTTEPLTEDIEVTGPVHVKLFAASSATDTDFTGKFTDVYPTGQSVILTEGIVRARLRNSFKKEELITPGKVYEYTIDLWSTSNLFKKGHRIRVEISSSNFPKYDRNPNTGHPFGQDAELKSAEQTIYHDADRASYLMLPRIPR